MSAPRPAYRGDDDIGLAREGGQVARAGVADGDCGVRAGRLLHEQGGKRLPDDIAAPDDDDVFPCRIVAGADEHLLDAGGSRGEETRVALQEASAVDGVHPVDVLVGVYGEDDLPLLDMRGQRKLNEDAVKAGVGVELPHERDQLFLRGLLRQLERLTEHARLVAGAALVAHVDG